MKKLLEIILMVVFITTLLTAQCYLIQQITFSNKAKTALQQKCDNLAVSLGQINNMLPVESALADGRIIYQEVNRVLAGNGYPQLQRQLVAQPTALSVVE